MRQVINITIPVFNEEEILTATIERVARDLRSNLPHDCEIVIASNGSTDRTVDIARVQERLFPNVTVTELGLKGRGRALKRAWRQSSADILTYMDCDLSTELSCFEALVCPLLHGSHDIVAGSRLLGNSSTKRGIKRTIISRAYNVLIQSLLRVRFSDAQCGFKAISRQAFAELGPLCEDDGWFFDTELLVIAEKLGYRIFDLPVRWTDTKDTKVKILQTAFDDIKGLMRLRRNLAQGKYPSRNPP